MKKLKNYLLIFTLIFFTIACSFAPRIDTSSEEAFQKSYDKIVSTLDDEKKNEFDLALMKITYNNFSLIDAVFGNKSFLEYGEGIIYDTANEIHGKTADQIIQLADKK